MSAAIAQRGQDGVAVIGMSCRFPGAPSVEAYWRNILRKVDAVSDPPPEAWDLDVYYDPAFADSDRTYCKRGGYLGAMVSFEPLAHGIPPIAVGGEPDQWLALEVAREAMADASCAELAESVRRRTAVVLGKGTYLNGGNAIAVQRGLVVGQTLEIIRQLHPGYTDEQIELLRAEMKRVLPPIGPETVPGLVPNVIVGRIANRLDLMGPTYTVDAACASSLVAVQLAMRDLLTGECDLALAGGSQVWMPVPTLNVFCQLGALSRRQQIRPFDEGADGTLLGEGIGMVVLKRLADAERDGDRIYAVVRGVGVASDGRGTSVMAPRVEGEELALRRAYETAGVDPQTVGLIEAHGTATPVGDLVEIQALTRVFGGRDGQLARCAIGTVKSMISHTIPAAGVAGLIKVALALHQKVLPPTLNCDRPNPKLDLERTPFYVNTETRPWVHGGAEPRRAGVNAFGFGGINAHAVVEEHRPGAAAWERQAGPAADGLDALPDWESEVFVLPGETADEIVGQAKRLARFLERAETSGRSSGVSADGTVALRDLAYTLNCLLERPGAPLRLGVVATSLGDLREKLERAVERLADPGCRQIKDRAGIYYAAEPLARSGKVAVLLPGEGAQYPNMLADLCLHFPEVRACFDRTDRIFDDHPRGYRLSDCVFPRPAFSEEERRWASSKLMQLDVAVEAVLTSNQAVLTLLGRLGLRPAMYVGHSTGEYSAMLASGLLDLDDEERLAGFCRALNRFYETLASQDGVPRAVLLALATDRAHAEAIASEAGGGIYLAMDNCPHQAVLVGEAEAAARALEIVRRDGLIHEQLSFDRAYHTELFVPYAEHLREPLAGVPVRPVHTTAYSCTTAAPYPADPDEARQLIVEHWSRPVEFRRTIEALHADGVRLFVEAGPRGNLTAFVEDILRGREFCAVPADVQRRAGTTQLNHLVATLSAHGVDLDLTALYERRQPRLVPWAEESAQSAPRPPAHRIELATRWPMLSLAPDIAERLRSLDPGPPRGDVESAPGAPGSAAGAEPPRAAANEARLDLTAPGGSAAELVAPVAAVHGAVGAVPEPDGGLAEAVDPAAPKSMAAYLETMDRFLELQEQVMRGYLAGADCALAPVDDGAGSGGTAGAPAVGDQSVGSGVAPTGPPAPIAGLPLLGEVVSSVEGKELVARRRYDLDEDRYLLDHTLGRGISALDPDLTGLVVMPLAMSLEIVAEAAAALLPGLVVVGMRQVRASRWLAWDEEPPTLEVSARRLPADGARQRVLVRLRELSEDHDRPLSAAVEAVVLLGQSFDPAPAASGVRPGGEPSRLHPGQLYGEVMFHGPSWQGVSSVDQTSDGGAVATLRVLPRSELLRSTPWPEFVLDPVALDAAGQIVGFWTAERLESGKVVFPFGLESLELYGPPRPTGEAVRGVAAIGLLGGGLVRSDIDLIGADGRLWMRLIGWQDKRFEVPLELEPLLGCAGWTDLSTACPEPIVGAPDRWRLECRRLSTSASPDRAFWNRVWADRILSWAERAQFRHRRGSEERRTEWLAGRTAAKEAVRQLLRELTGLALEPADIEIEADAQGRPRVGGAWQSLVGARPTVSLAHSGGHAVALAGLASAGAVPGAPLIGVDAEVLRALPEGFAETAFAPDELARILDGAGDERNEWLLRAWCAKEAVAKALGVGLIEGPSSVSIAAVDAGRGLAAAQLEGRLAEIYPDLAADHLVVHTVLRDGLVVAATCGETLRARLSRPAEVV